MKFALLNARRTAPLAALVGIGAATFAAGRLAPTGMAFATELGAPSASAGAQSAWTMGLAIAAVLIAWHAARTPDRWLSDEGDWLGAAAASRPRLIASTLVGFALGTALIVAVIGACVRASGVGAGPGSLVEHSAVAGPARSLVLLPGESFEQALGPLRAGTFVRVRVTPTLGAETPTTEARIVMGARARNVMVARRTWLELDAASPTDAGSIRIDNVGQGALAVLGPQPVEIWTPSNALFSGHVRVALHGMFVLTTLAFLAFGLGCAMGPAVAALLALATWLGLRMLVEGTGAASLWPAASELTQAIAAVREGRAPAPILGRTLASVLVTALLVWASASAGLRSYRQEARG